MNMRALFFIAVSTLLLVAPHLGFAAIGFRWGVAPSAYACAVLGIEQTVATMERSKSCARDYDQQSGHGALHVVFPSITTTRTAPCSKLLAVEAYAGAGMIRRTTIAAVAATDTPARKMALDAFVA
jgi:hypothetical protein